MSISRFITLILLSIPLTMTSQVIISEFGLEENSFIELQNIGPSSVDVTDYYMVFGQEVIRVGMYFPFCGGVDQVLSPNEFLLFEMQADFSWIDGELGLFVNDQVNDPTYMIDYVQWGSGGHAHEALADSANIWATGDFVVSLLEGGSIEYDGDGDSSSDYTLAAVSSGCMPNGSGCIVGVGTVTPSQNPFLACIGDGQSEYMGHSFHGNISETLRHVILNGNHDILAQRNIQLDPPIELPELDPADTVGMYGILFGHNGPIGNLSAGHNLSEVVGCFAYSDPVPFESHFVSIGTLTGTYLDTVFEETIHLCAGDSIPDIVTFTNSAEHGTPAFFIYNPDDGRITTILDNEFTYDFNGDTLDMLMVVGIAYVDMLDATVGQNVLFADGDPCSAKTANEITINLDMCISSAGQVTEESFMHVFPNPASFEVIISGTAISAGNVAITDLLGRRVLRTEVDETGKVNVSSLVPGMYLIHFDNGKHRSQSIFIKI